MPVAYTASIAGPRDVGAVSTRAGHCIQPMPAAAAVKAVSTAHRRQRGSRSPADRKGLGKDSRHNSMKIIHEAQIEQRTFPSWRIAHLDATPERA